MITQKTVHGPTPNGGVKSTMFYLDNRGQPVGREHATKAIIIEYDAKGEELHRTYGTLKGDNRE